MSKPRKTHCPSGHPYDEANSIYRGNKAGPRCRICLEAIKKSRKETGYIRLQGKIPNAIADATGWTQRESYLAFWTVIAEIKKELLAGRVVNIRTFGRFYLKHSGAKYVGAKLRPNRWGENFMRGSTRPYIYIRFQPSTQLKKILNPKPTE
jgi:nucleoid DNA-binding protein